MSEKYMVWDDDLEAFLERVELGPEDLLKMKCVRISPWKAVPVIADDAEEVRSGSSTLFDVTVTRAGSE